jgi:hypothetical protein
LAKLIINPTFHTCAYFFDFWSIGAQGNIIMDAIYKSEKKEKKL